MFTTIVILAVFAILVSLWRCGKLSIKHSSLKQQLDRQNAELKTLRAFQIRTREHEVEHREQDRQFYAEQVQQLRSEVKSLKNCAFRLPSGCNVRHITSPIGTFAIRTVGGYFGESAIFVYFPIGFGFSQEVANALLEVTEGRFVMDAAKGNSNGGDSTADAMITAGLDYDAYRRGERGYFKSSPPPKLDEIADILSRIIVHPQGVTAQLQ